MASSCWRAVPACAVALAVLVSLGFGGPARAAAAPQCQPRSMPVHLSPADPVEYQLVGWACWQGSTAGKPVQVLVSGFTYDHTYWDFPFQPQRYSYVRSATNAGYVTFNLDRPGSGLSGYPPSALLTASAHVYVLHQVLGALRAWFPGSKLVTVGHSAGSAVALQEAADYADIDGLVLTGLLHAPDPPAATVFASFYPAALDPKFAAASPDPGYLTTRPGTRGADFYHLAVADPLVVATDELLKSTGSVSELGTGDTAFLATTSWSVHVPVLLAVGEKDNSFCDPALGLSCADSAAILDRESANFAADACLEAYVLPASGHVINLHPNAPQWFAAANDWLGRRTAHGCG